MLGPFPILKKVGTQVYKLYLSPYFRLLYLTYHISVLELYHNNTPTNNDAPKPIEIDNQVEYKIERILSHRGKKNRSYLVK